MQGVFAVAACASVLAVALICIFLFANGIPAMSKIGFGEFLTGELWKPKNDIYGIFPMIIGSLYVTAGAIIIGVPIGILTAVFMAFYCPKVIYKPLKMATELLAGIPSVVYGFFGLVVLVPWVREIGRTLHQGGNGSSMITIFTVVLPAAKSGVVAAIVLGIGRAIGETMAVIMVAGNQPRMPEGIFRGVRTLTANIVIEMGYASGLHREALIATGVVLFVFILLLNFCVALLKRGKNYE